MRRNQLHPLIFAILVASLLPPISTLAAEIHVQTILTTRPIPAALPAFHDANRAGVTWEALLTDSPAQPETNTPQANATWATIEAADNIFVLPGADQAHLRYLAFYITSNQWQKQTLTLTGDQILHGAMDNQKLAFATTDSNRSVELTLPAGKHLVILRALPHDNPDQTWSVGISFTSDADTQPLAFSLKPEHAVDINTVLDAPRIGGVTVSPDGRYTAISLSEYRDGEHQERWLEVRETSSGKLVRLWRGGHAPGQAQWFPHGHRLTWRTNTGDTATLRTFDFDDGATAIILADVKNLGNWTWAPNGASLVYEINHNPEPDPRRVKHVMYPADRQPWWRSRTHLRQVFVPSGAQRQLTAGPVSPNGWQISPDSKRIVFFTTDQDLTQRPYFATDMWLLDLATLTTDKVLSDPWIEGASWSPDSKQLLLAGTPSAFSNLGRDLPEGVQANEYSGQLYLFDLATRQPTVITLNLKPDVTSAAWSTGDGMIYALTAETQYDPVYRLKPGANHWEHVATGVDVTNQIALASGASVAVIWGSGAHEPNTVHRVDLKRNRSRLVLDPGTTDYKDVVFGKIENWVAPLDKGMDLDGFIYYPPNFDPSRKYPVIVYYYGGTIAITRDFGGRYPKNIWAGQGYVVYVPNPSGATGYGQAFTARHVNDWGKLAGAEIIEGTQKFLEAHPFADPSRVACMGASFGGFLTDYVITQTDIFAAAISHAGISDITSYWGEGFWGYDYGSRALANSFPWTDQDLFVGQSPLFHADQVTTPLLLLHGDADVNVPKGESIQFFTALKLLGQDVEYVEFKGQDHHILDHEQRITWNDTILAYLAKYLKGRPGWWDAMYPAPEDYR